MAYQFGHVGWAARSRTAKKTTTRQNSMTTRAAGWSAADLAGEAMRLPGHCDHVAEPMPPRVLYGVDPMQAAAEAEAWGGRAKEANGRALRRNAPVMAAGVVSFPRERLDDWPAFRDATVEALKDKYGDRLRSVVEHLDEAHPHLHFYAVPRPGEAFGVIHEGYKASREARKEPGNKIREAYTSAMKGWQDWLHGAVGQRFGLERIGPARERRERDEHLLARGQEQVLKDREQLAGELRDVRREARALERKATELDEVQRQRLADLRQQEAELKAARQAIDDEAKRVKAEAEAVGRREGRQRGYQEGLQATAVATVGEKLGAAWRELKRHISGDPEREREAMRRMTMSESRAATADKTAGEAKAAAAAAEARAKKAEQELAAEREQREVLQKRLEALQPKPKAQPKDIGFGAVLAAATRPRAATADEVPVERSAPGQMRPK